MAVFRTIDDEGEHIGTAYWLKYIRWRIMKNKNFMAVFIGQTGSGKSYSALGLAEELQEGGLNMDNVFLKAGEFLKRIVAGQLKKGDVLTWDEAGIDLNSKQWQSKANRVVNAVMQVFRKDNLIVLFTLPYFSFLDSDARKLVHAVFETQGIDFKTKEVIIKPMIIQVNQSSGKMYKKYLRVKVPGKGLMPIKKIRIGLADAAKLVTYEQKKEEFSRKLYQDAYESIMAIEEPKKDDRKRAPLTEKQKEVLKLEEEGYTPEEMAVKLGISVSAVIQRLELARKKAKKG